MRGPRVRSTFTWDMEKCCAANRTTEGATGQDPSATDRWISRGFKGGGEGASRDPTQKETAVKVSEVADLNRAIAEEEAKKRDA